MPLYDFRSKKTGKIQELMMTISQMEQFVIDHPELEKVIAAPNVVNADSVGRRNMKVPSDFKHIVERAKANKKKSKRINDSFDNRGTRYSELANRTEI